MILIFSNTKVLFYKYTKIYFLAILQSPRAVPMHISGYKSCCKMVLKVQNLGIHILSQQSLLLSTTVLNVATVIPWYMYNIHYINYLYSYHLPLCLHPSKHLCSYINCLRNCSISIIHVSLSPTVRNLNFISDSMISE